MKLTVYCLIFVIVAAAVIGIVGVGVGLIDRRPSDIAGWHGQCREVYVDLDKLMVLHPGWAVAKGMKSVSSDVSASQTQRASEPAADVSWLQLPDIKARSAAFRWRVEDSAAKRADDALISLRTEQLAALQARLEATRKTMADSSEADIRQRTYEIEQDAANKISVISQEHSHAQINLRVKAGALREMLGQPGVDEADVKKRLAAVESDLNAIETEVQKEVAGVTADAQKTISGLSASADAKVAAALTAYGNRETRAIESRITEARNQVMSDICSLSEISAPDVCKARGSVSGSIAGKPVIASRPAYGRTGDARLWTNQASQLEDRVRKDVVATVQRLAGERHLKVVFTRKHAGVPDETDTFVGLIKDRGWRLGEPVLQGA